MAVGRISGPLLKANLLRDGVPLAFETDLLYLDVITGRIGVKTTSPSDDLHVAGTSRTTNLLVDTQADLATFTISGSTISSSSGTINIEPTGASPVVYQAKIQVDDLTISGNTIESLDNITIRTNGTGVVNIQSNVEVDGNIHATGNITADGDITFGAGAQTQGSGDDTVTFVAEVASDIIPDVHNTYQLGTVEKKWADVYTENLFANAITTGDIVVDGINLILPQGNIIYVSVNGDDGNSGTHEQDPYLTVKYALSQAVSGDTIYIYPGVYAEIFPMTIPVGVTVRGSSMRSVKIIPTSGTRDKDVFLLNGETTVEDVTLANFEYNAGDDTGYSFRFAANMLVTTRSPYIRNVTVITFGSTVRLATAPADDPRGYLAGDAGRGAFADGSVVNASSKEASMLFHAVTFITPAAETLKLTNGVRIEWLNSFSYFASKAINAYSTSTGFAGAGKTRLRINTRTGTWAAGNTVSYYDTDGTTLLASGTIASIEGNFVNLTGRCLGFETLTDRPGKTVYTQGDAKLSIAQQKFGTASLVLDGVGDYITIASQSDFEYGTGDFTFEFFWRPTALGTQQILLDCRTASNDTALYLEMNTAGNIRLFVSNAYRITSSVACSAGAFNHIALFRVGGVTKLAVNGTLTPTTWADTTNYPARPVRMGASWTGGAPSTGYIDEVRVVKGVAKYTTSVTVPTAPLAGDLSTVLLLHFNGANNSTTFIDDGVTLQDVRTSAGGSASLINFADYSQFGAEIRSIGSAAVYGTYGAYGDGDGVLMYLISQNFAYIGAGQLTTNDPNDRIAANEVVKLNRAKIYYTSVDNEGNFSVGDAFFVNQATGEVLFNGDSLSITTPAGITFTDGVNSTTITPTNIDTGNIRISGNTIESLTGDVNLVAASGAINLQNNTFVTGNLDVTGDIILGGNITIGDTATDTINFVGGISSNLIPATTATYNLGQGGLTPLRWNNVYLSRAEIDGLVIDSNVIETTTSNTDLTLQANGTGRIYIPGNNVQIDQNLTVTTDLTVTTGTTYLKNTTVVGTITQTGDINQTGSFTTSGNTQVTGNITGTGYLQLPQVTITGNTIQTTVTNLDLQLTANGTGNVILESLEVQDNKIKSTGLNANVILTPQASGSVVIDSNQSLIIPLGDIAARPGTPTNGMIRYNTELGRYEGYNNGYWLTLSGVADSDGNTYISAELTPGANDNTLRFYADGNLMVTIDSTKLFAERLQTSNLNIQTDTISSIATDSDINLTATGTGSVRVGNLSIKNNTITNVVSGAVTEFVETGTGYISISGTNGVVIPSGNDSGRPGVPEIGMIRYSTEQGLVEVYNGIIWTSVAGTGGGITFNDATQIAIEYVLTFG